MDRERIERRDFPTGRRGYDPAAVDEHLRRVADEFETHVDAPRASLADSTSEQVRLILDAAERGADRAALAGRRGGVGPRRPRRGRRRAGCSPSSTPSRASSTRLLAALRASGERLAEGLAELQAEVSAARRAAPPAFPPPPAAPASPPESTPPAASSPPDTARRRRPPPRRPRPTARPPRSPISARSRRTSPPTEPADAGARLIALNMALSGSPREETARYLAEHFELDDAEALLDDVYARAGR